MTKLLTLITALCLIAIPLQADAAKKGKVESDKDKLVLMPLRVPEEDKNLNGAMETALVEGLKLKYEVFSGERVAQKAHEIYMKESRLLGHTECDETRCMQNIAEAFQAELIATANVTKQNGSYFLALSIQNIFDNKVEYSKSLPCENCSEVQVVDKLKTLGNTSTNSQLSKEEAEAQRIAEIKIKAEQLKQEQSAFEEKLRKADAAEKKRLLDAKAIDDKRLAELKAQAEAHRKSTPLNNDTKFPTIELAVAEVNRLNENIKSIEAGYENELAQTRKSVTSRYEKLLSGISKSQKDEFETTTEFNARKDKQRSELIVQRDEELSRLNTDAIASSETSPLRMKIVEISSQVYTLGAESIAMILDLYDADNQQFKVTLHSKTTVINFNISASISLPSLAAKTFKQQWLAGLIHPEAKLKPFGTIDNLLLINDADNTQLIFSNDEFFKESDVNIFLPMMLVVQDENHNDVCQISTTEVTQAQWNALLNPSTHSDCPKCPAVVPSWKKAQEYIQQLNKKATSEFRFPTENELKLAYNNPLFIHSTSWNWIDCTFCVGDLVYLDGDIKVVKGNKNDPHDIHLRLAGPPLIKSSTQEDSTKPRYNNLPNGFFNQGRLTWMSPSFTMDWANANAYCANTSINGMPDWRLPTKYELNALYNSGVANGSGWALVKAWSITPNGKGYHYVMEFSTGLSVHSDIDSSINYVTCVHN